MFTAGNKGVRNVLCLFLRLAFIVQQANAYEIGSSMKSVEYNRLLQVNVTGTPTSAPTFSIANVTELPTSAPTVSPTLAPTTNLTIAPTDAPTIFPTASPILSNLTDAPTDAPTVSPTASPTASPTSNLTEAPTDSPTLEPTEQPTEFPTITPAEAEGIDIESVFVVLGIIGFVLFLGVVGYFAITTIANNGGDDGSLSNPNNYNPGGAGKPIIVAAAVKNNRDSMSTIYSRDRWSTVSGGDDAQKIEAKEGKDNNLMSLLRDKRHEHNVKRAEEPKNRVTLPTVKRQVMPDTKSMKEMDAEGSVEESEV